MPDACPTCGSTLGTFDGPNGPRCINCMHDTTFGEAKGSPSPEPNAGGTSQAKATATKDQFLKGSDLEPGDKSAAEEMRDKTVKAQDKAVRGPKEKG